MPASKLSIVPDTKVADLLTVFPDVEPFLLERAPSLSLLQNPALRATVMRATSLEQLSKANLIDVVALVHELRSMVGQDTITDCPIDRDLDVPFSTAPAVMQGKVVETIDARDMLAQGIHPKDMVLDKAQTLLSGESLHFITPFLPSPLLELLQSAGFMLATEFVNEAEVHTFITRP